MRLFIYNIFIAVFVFCSASAHAQDEPFVIKYGPYLQNVGSKEATIVWVTNRNSVSWVEIAPDDGSHFYAVERPQYYHTTFGKKNIGTLHRVVIDSLVPQTTYRYRIYSKEVTSESPYLVTYGKVAASDAYQKAPYKFSTLDSHKPTTDFVVVNDIHASSDLFTALMENENLDSVDMVFLNGDMVSSMNSEKELFDGFLSQCSNLFAKETPMFFVRGNHETRGVFSTHYIDYFPSSTGKPYYTFSQGPVFFVVLDPGEDKPDNDIEYHGLADFDKYRRDEAAWLKGVVCSDEFTKAEVRIVLIHIPPMGGTWHGNLELNRLFMPLLNSSDIDLMICAHEHRHRFMQKGDDGANFPMIVNSNKNSLRVRVDSKMITLDLKDDTGAKVKNYTIRLK
ncbi:MAG: FN3 domain-containing metallophosphoesterase family protein [Rikenellaceae bacterium]